MIGDEWMVSVGELCLVMLGEKRKILINSQERGQHSAKAPSHVNYNPRCNLLIISGPVTTMSTFLRISCLCQCDEIYRKAIAGNFRGFFFPFKELLNRNFQKLKWAYYSFSQSIFGMFSN